MSNYKPIAILLIGSLGLLIVLAFWASDTTNTSYDEFLTAEDEELLAPLSLDELTVTEQGMTNEGNPVAVMTTNRGVIKLELYEDVMPVTVGNFTKLAEEGYYDGIKFHRVIEGFMIQGGDPNTKTDNVMTYGTGGPGYTIQDEFVAEPYLTNVRGTIAMANTGQPNSGGSQFFINTADNINLDFDKTPVTSRHPVFGRVVEGMDVVDAIEGTETGPRDVPVEPVIIESLVIERTGATEESTLETEG